MSSGISGFQSVNIAHQQDTLDAFANLATSNASNHATVVALTVTNRILTDNCTATHALLVTALQDVTKLQAGVADLKHQLSTRSHACYNTTTSYHYCWNCGHRCDHTSKRFPDPSSGHQYDATHA